MQVFPCLRTFWAASPTISSRIVCASSSTEHSSYAIDSVECAILDLWCNPRRKSQGGWGWRDITLPQIISVKKLRLGLVAWDVAPSCRNQYGKRFDQFCTSGLTSFCRISWCPYEVTDRGVSSSSTIHLAANIFPSTTPHHAIKLLSPCLLNLISW